MELDKDKHDVYARKILDLLEVDSAIQSTVKSAVENYEQGGSGYAKRFFTIPRSARHEVTDHDVQIVGDVIDAAILATPDVRSGFALVWERPGLIFPGRYSITLYIDIDI